MIIERWALLSAHCAMHAGHCSDAGRLAQVVVKCAGCISYVRVIVQVLKEILRAISMVRSKGPEMELRYLDLCERFRTRMHTCKPELKEELQSELDQCARLQSMWDSLGDEAMQTDAALEDVKVDFCDITRQQIETFEGEVQAFYERFQSTGPSRGNIELSAGLKLLWEVEAELTSLLQRRDELVLAQKLFDMDITSYPELSKVRC